MRVTSDSGRGSIREAAHRRTSILEHFKDRIDLRDVQQIVYALGRVQQLYRPALVLDGRISRDQLSDPGAVDVGDIGQVQQNLSAPARDQFADQIPERRSVLTQCDAAGGIDDSDFPDVDGRQI